MAVMVTAEVLNQTTRELHSLVTAGRNREGEAS
jgi:hypothetical protein